jgi:hypothetical protein
MSALRWIMNAIAAIAMLVVLSLGGLWAADRVRRWDAPSWNSGGFVALRGPAPGQRGRWVVVVNPACASCMATLARLDSVWTRAGSPTPLAALLVDLPGRPRPAALRAIATPEIWWDRDGAWRNRWGHRVYGELLRFDDDGHHLRTIAAGEVLRALDEMRDGRNAPAWN